ncbi:MAG: cytidylate kinase-like family protein, partial [Lachnospiraceae bacterium]|nr:cytidylate kinase-like family protein [Lachnospiraceae bacterium]
MNNVIAIGREFGSGGREFGRRLAGELGYEYYDKEVLTEIVNHTSLSENYVHEVIEGKAHRLFPITIEQSFNIAPDYSMQQVQDIFRAQTDVIKKMAHSSNCVIVGRCADYILREEPDIRLFRLFVLHPGASHQPPLRRNHGERQVLQRPFPEGRRHLRGPEDRRRQVVHRG